MHRCEPVPLAFPPLAAGRGWAKLPMLNERIYRRVAGAENLERNENPMADVATTKQPRVTDSEQEQIARANHSGLTPVVFVHGLWLLPSSWDRWAAVYEEAGYTALTPGWPDDPGTVEEANAHPEVFAGKTVGQVADHYAAVISKLAKKPLDPSE